MSAKVICFDGPDGVGKSTQLAMAKDALEKQGFKVHATRVPGGTPIGEELRKIVLSDLERPAETDLHLMMAIHLALAYDVEKRRDNVDYILIDRGPLAFVAYQVYGSGVDVSAGVSVAKEIIDKLKPETLLFFSAPVEVTHERLVKEAKKLDYFESKSADFHQKVLEGYEAAVKLFDVTVVDSEPDAETIHEEVMKIIAG